MFISNTMIRLLSIVEASQKMEVKSESHKGAKSKSYLLDFKTYVIHGHLNTWDGVLDGIS